MAESISVIVAKMYLTSNLDILNYCGSLNMIFNFDPSGHLAG